MIEIVKDKTELKLWKGRDLYSVRILSLLNAYNCKYPFALFYKQVIDGKIVSIFSKLDGDVTIALSEKSDLFELSDFVQRCSFSSVLVDSKLKINSSFDEGIIMKSTKHFEPTKLGAEIDEYPRLMDLFNLIDYDSVDFETWYVDISHRIRHGSAKAFSLKVRGEMIASAIFSSIFGKYAILSSVSTIPEFRRLGYGSFLVSNMVADFKGTVYLMREQDKNEEFYLKNGFINIGEWRIYK